jgi:NAD(P)-dependent dehydrogenase (short-subunit alcohol dehydrogenase family)
MELKDKVAVITGAASGIGRACAQAFAAAGARVMVADVNGDGARAAAAAIGGQACTCDVGDEGSVNDLVAATERRFGPVDVFFSNAAIASGGDPLNTPLDLWQKQWQVNVMGHVYAVRAMLPGMLERGSGYLLHTASMAGYLTSQGNLPYAVTKHAVVGLAEWMSVTYHERGIRVSLLAPLGVRTPMLVGAGSTFSQLAVGSIVEPELVARQVTEAIAEERFLILTDPLAQAWMERKTNDPERWLKGMRRLQLKMDEINRG